MMKNMKISAKLTVGFAIVIGLALIIGVVLLLSLNKLSLTNAQMYEDYVLPPESLTVAGSSINEARTQYHSIIVNYFYKDAENAQSAKVKFESCLEDFLVGIEQISVWAETDKEKQLLSELQDVYTNKYLPSAIETINLAMEDMPLHEQNDTVETLIAENSTISQRLSDIISELSALKAGEAKTISDENQSMYRIIFIFTVVAIPISIIIAVIIVGYLSNIIGKPIKTVSDFFIRFQSMGDLSLSEDDKKNIAANSGRKDEIGKCINAAVLMVQHIVSTNEQLDKIAGGDLAFDVEVLSQKDSMGLAVSKMVGSLNAMFGEINASAIQVSAASGQIADGAQSLAQGTTEQASAVEELSASISEITDKTKRNASTANEAVELSGTICGNAEKGSKQMEQMMQAVTEINEASQSINKIIKAIDDIAFQTNILALNAAVEAARAGQYGKGFAVVAEEVRNLAAKSAEAAKNTGVLIENSIEKANLGLNIATETSASLRQIVDGINRSAEIVAQIARSSDEQAAAITQINTGVNQVAQIVQQNSATAEQSAAASEEMSGQSNVLKQLILRFKLRGVAASSSLPPSSITGAIPKGIKSALDSDEQSGKD